ncbi:acyl carrier protein [uncultured Methylobacterium sp.]|jgi:acyl carrier protein|uniref:acyl carrier protein n=1 Tax=uncultured Methylobacterium sp. TaxID=157278 RepID=UPI0026070ABF|nr:acyl carrier protein [uncultured Methylobacterium sp.]
MSIRLTVLDNIKRIAEEQQKPLAPLSDDLVLTESGLDSLCFAILVARLDAELGLDPFTTEEDIVFPVTVGDFIRLYEGAAVDEAA